MSEQNPFAAPRSNIDRPGGRQYPNIELVATGQKLVIYAILIYLFVFGRGFVAPRGSDIPDALAGVVGFAILGLSLLGVYRIATGLEIRLVFKVLCTLLALVPLVSLVVLLVFNSKATRALRDAGYTVGLLGASRPK